MTGNLSYWKLGEEGGDNLHNVQFYTTGDERPFNQLFAAAYNFLLWCERIGLLAPSAELDMKAIFKEKVFGTKDIFVIADTICGVPHWQVAILHRHVQG